jgi:hypothetical protein
MRRFCIGRTLGLVIDPFIRYSRGIIAVENKYEESICEGKRTMETEGTSPLSHHASRLLQGLGSEAVLKQANTLLPEFVGVNPATGKPVNTKGLKILGTSSLTGAIVASKAAESKAPNSKQLTEARRKLAGSVAYDGTEEETIRREFAFSSNAVSGELKLIPERILPPS